MNFLRQGEMRVDVIAGFLRQLREARVPVPAGSDAADLEKLLGDSRVVAGP